jgi:hypothetical protein
MISVLPSLLSVNLGPWHAGKVPHKTNPGGISVYQQFTDRARKVMQLANREAQQLQHDRIGTLHILMGLIKADRGVAVAVLTNLDVDLRELRRELEEALKSDAAEDSQTSTAEKVIEYSMKSARDLRYEFVGTEQVLLGLLHDHDSPAAKLLAGNGLTLESVRAEVVKLCGQPEEPEPSSRDDLLKAYENDPRVAELLVELDRLNREKEEAIHNRDFEEAARLRDLTHEIRSRGLTLLSTIDSEQPTDRGPEKEPESGS